MIWAWQRAENLNFIEGDTGVAVLVATIKIENNKIRVQPRLNPLQAPSGVFILPVIRIEANGMFDPDELELEISQVARGPGVQIDFDAMKSQRKDYISLLRRLRLHKEFISVTALASWCLGDRWIPENLVDEVVPMLFDMSHDGPSIKRYLSQGEELADQCQASVGIADYDPVRVEADHYYFFNKKGFDAHSWRQILHKVEVE